MPYTNPHYSTPDHNVIDILDPLGRLISCNADDQYTASLYAHAVAGTFGPIAAYIAPVRTKGELLAYANRKADGLLTTTRTYVVEGMSLPADAMDATLNSLKRLSDWGATNPTSTARVWVANDGSTLPVLGAEYATFSALVEGFEAHVYEALAAVSAGVNGETITTFGQIDAFAWPA